MRTTSDENKKFADFIANNYSKKKWQWLIVEKIS